MTKTKIVYGKKSQKGTYPSIPLGDIVGKTVEAVGDTTVEGPYGNEPCILLFFTDGTSHGFVLPADDEC